MRRSASARIESDEVEKWLKELPARLQDIKDEAVVATAIDERFLDTFPERNTRLTHGDVPEYLCSCVVELWNETATWLDNLLRNKYGSQDGFGLWLERQDATGFRFKNTYPEAWLDALSVLGRLSAARDRVKHSRMDHIDWMLNLMFAGGIPQNDIIWEATARKGSWWTKLRFRRENVARKQRAAYRDKLLEMADAKKAQHDREWAGVFEWRRRTRADRPLPQPAVTSAASEIPPIFELTRRVEYSVPLNTASTAVRPSDDPTTNGPDVI